MESANAVDTYLFNTKPLANKTRRTKLAAAKKNENNFKFFVANPYHIAYQ